MIGWIIFFVVFIGMMISLVFVVLKLKNVATGGVPPNSKIYIFFGAEGTKGHALGVGVKADVPQSGSTEYKLVTCKPLDIPYNHKGKPIRRENFEVGIHRNFSINISSGSNSLFRDFCFVFPRIATELPKEMRNNPLGKAIVFANTYLSLNDKAVKYLEEHESTITQALNSVKQQGDDLFITYKREMENALKERIKEKSTESNDKDKD